MGGPRVETSRKLRLTGFVAPLTAAVLAIAAGAIGWHGVDLPAATYRVGLFRRSGFTLWDSQWYGGHWTLSYSVLFPPVAGLLGLTVVAALSSAIAAWAFDRIVVEHFGSSARVGSMLFAVGTLAQVAIGQLPFLLGEALALSAYLAATRGRFRVAVVLGVAASLASPLAAAFLVLAAGAWLLVGWRRGRGGLILLVAVPAAVVLGLGVLFPGQGVMPFPFGDFLSFAAIATVVLILVPRERRGIRLAVALYLGAAAVSFVLPTPMGGNISRLGECLGAPLAACMLWPHRRAVLAGVMVPLTFMHWAPAFATLPTDQSDLSTSSSYFAPLLGFLRGDAGPMGRVEIVPTRRHWEAAYAAPTVLLARGWERQLDTADNPIFYDADALGPDSYKAWLVDNGVRYVALPDVALDYAAVDEAQLVEAGVPGLRLAWSNLHWRVYEVTDSPGIVEGPATLVRLDGTTAVLTMTAPGTSLVRIRFSDRWGVAAGSAALQPAPADWTNVVACRPGEVRLQLHLLPADQDEC